MGGTRICRRFAALIMLICAAAFLLVCTLPRTAFAGDYTCPEVTINADIQSDGSLRVVELRSFDFNDTSLVWWGIKYDFNVHDVQFGTMQENGDVQFTSLSQTMFNTSWRQGNAPDAFAWSQDAEEGFLYVAFPKTTGKAVIRIDYTMPNGVGAYKDCSELYWSYVSNSWPTDSNNVTCTISLPVPAGITPAIGSTVYAWGHGPENGTFAFNLAGTAITYHDDRVPAWSYADARVVFPRGWLTNLSPEQISLSGNSNYFNSILYQEEDWADDYHWRQWWQSVILLVSCALGIIVVLAALLLWYVRGRDHKPKFDEKFWTSEPAEGLHPCIVSKLRAFSFENDARDAATALLHLANKGAVHISRAKPPLAEASDQQTGLVLTRQSDSAAELDTIDRATMVLFFDELGDNHTSVSLDKILELLQEQPRAFRIALGTWRRNLDAEMQQYGLIDETGNDWQKRLVLLACALFLPGLLLVILDSPALMGLYALVMLPASVALFAISSLMPRLTPKGTEIMARAEALRRWLWAFADNAEHLDPNVSAHPTQASPSTNADPAQVSHSGNEQPACDEQYWKNMLLYAFMFNIDACVIAQLRSTCPHLFAMSNPDNDNLPWWVLYEEFASEANGVDDDPGDELV